MQTHTHGNGRGLDDLYVLPDSAEESARIVAYLDSRNVRYHWSHSDVEGQDWHGRNFLEIPFGEGLRGVIEQAARGEMTTYNASFVGRKLGADGIFYPIIASVTAADEEEARLHLYERFEHIQNLKLTK